jgi:predicted ATPase
MAKITRFEIIKLHGFRSFDLKIKNNTLILVGENGAGKTTVLNLFFYLLSGQWSSIAKYQFETLAITIDSKRYTLNYTDIERSLHKIDQRLLRKLPPNVRRRIYDIMESPEPRLISGEIEMLSHQYDIPLSYLVSQLNLFEHADKKKTDALERVLIGIEESLKAQLLYLPTYRRIEQELSRIFKGLDERELAQRRHLANTRRHGNTFVELVEFGMKDVDSAVNEMLTKLDKFARENLVNLTSSYLGDIVEEQYQSVELDRIKQAEPTTIDNILNRIPEPILSTKNKQHLKEIIEQVKNRKAKDVHTQVICHYFTKLMAFHQELESREANIVSFCKACNDYMVDKEFRYDTSNFTFTILSKSLENAEQEIQLQHLSSGEKQIVSLFSHLYLSGGKHYFVLIDEPELSLSVTWQRKFLSDIRNADFCVGLVAVTHSPFIYENDLLKYAHGLDEFAV